MHADWSIIEAIAATKKLDVWYLFPLSGLYRQATKVESKLENEKEAAIDRILGMCDWREKFYKAPPIVDMFGEEQGKQRGDWGELAKYVTERLRELFPYVSEPLVLPRKGIPKFALYFAVSNDKPRAKELAQRIVKHILRNSSF